VKFIIPCLCTCNPVFRGLGYQAGDFPESEQAAREVLALPFTGLTEAMQQAVVDETLKAIG